MAKAKKLPSGMWRVNAFSHRDAAGKQHRVSFTAPTKAEAEMKAAEYAANKHRKARHDLTIADAIDGYITAKEGVLSPSTLRSYRQMQEIYYNSIRSYKISHFTSEDMQIFISDLSVKLSPKSVRNIYGLLTASIALYSPDSIFRVTLPAKQIKRPVSPSDDEIRALYNAANDKMKVCILLGMYGLRRGEICALKYEDIMDGVAHIHADMVKAPDSTWIYKEMPKTKDSDRFIRLPDLGTGEGFIVKWTPDSITKRFIDLRDKLGLNIRFHDLRHYFASTAAVLDIPDIYTADMGGWKRGGSVMKSVYQNNVTSMSDYYSNKIAAHMERITKEDA